MSEELRAELLIDHAGFLRALARDLARDEGAADDLVQQTWLAALSHPPRDAGALRGWLGKVLRNCAWKDLRERSRSERMERWQAPGEAADPGEIAERKELLRKVASAVLGLPEPYATAIHLRYYEGLTPLRIAEREGTSPNTVKARLSRARARLREELDRLHGGERRAWSAVLLAGAPAYSGAFLPWLAAGALLLGGMACLLLLTTSKAEPAARDPGLQRAGVESAMPDARDLLVDRREPPALPQDVAHRVAGRVVDEGGRPVEGAELVLCHAASTSKRKGGHFDATERLFTDAQGRFGKDFDAPQEAMVFLLDGRWKALSKIRGREPTPVTDIEIVVAHQSSALIAVRARDLTTGKPIERFGCIFEVPTPDSSLPGKPGGFQGSHTGAETQSGVIRQWVALPSSRDSCRVLVSFRYGASARDSRLLLLRDGDRVEVEFAHRSGHSLRGMVVDGEGAPIAGAIVHDGNASAARGDEPFKPFDAARVADASVKSGADGKFEIAPESSHLTIWHPAFSPVTVPLAEAHRVVLSPRGAIRGRLLDAQGNPRAGVAIRLQRTRETLTDEAGGFAFDVVEAGICGLYIPDARRPDSISHEGGGPWSVRVDPGRTSEVEIGPGLPELKLFLRTGGMAYTDRVRAVLVGLDSPGSLTEARGEGGTLTAHGVLPGRYLFLTRAGATALVEISGPEATLDLGAAELTLRAAAGQKLCVVPQGVHDLARLIAERGAAQRVPDSGELRIAPLAAGRYEIVRCGRGDRSGEVVGQVELREEGTVVVVD